MARPRIAITKRRCIIIVLMLLLQPTARADSLAFTLPAPITETDVEFFSRWLMLSPAQSIVFGRFVEESAPQYADLAGKGSKAIQLIADAGGAEVMANGYTPEMLRILENFAEERNRYSDNILKLDALLLTRLSELLTDQQLQMLRHIDQWRQRRRCLLTSWDLRHAGVDVEQFTLSRLPNDPDIMEHLRPLLEEYAEAVTSLYVRVDKNAVQRSLESARIRASDAIPAEAKLAAMKEKLAGAAREEIKLGQRNMEFAEKVRDALPSELADEFWRAFQSHITPMSYPDLPVSRGYSEALIKLPELDAEVQAQIMTLWEQQRRALTALSEQMARTEREWRELIVVERAAIAEDEYRESMRNMRLERWEMHQSYLRELVSRFEAIMSPRQAAEIRGTINDINVLKDRAKDDFYPLR